MGRGFRVFSLSFRFEEIVVNRRCGRWCRAVWWRRRFGDYLVELVVVVTRRGGGNVGCGDRLDVFIGGMVAVVVVW